MISTRTLDRVIVKWIVVLSGLRKQEKYMTRTTEIEFELNETIAYTHRDERAAVFCPECQSLVEMAVPHVASILAEMTEREIYRRIEAKDAHFIETDRLLVCLNSLIGPETLVEEKSEG